VADALAAKRFDVLALSGLIGPDDAVWNETNARFRLSLQDTDEVWVSHRRKGIETFRRFRDELSSNEKMTVEDAACQIA
jgi:hypothetical protein